MSIVNSIVKYVQAGLDESLVSFVKGVFASAVVAGVGYAIKHYTSTPNLNEVVAYFVTAVPGALAFWKWATTTSGSTTTAVCPTCNAPLNSSTSTGQLG